MKEFQSYVSNVIIDTNDVYAYCNLFLLFGTNILLIKVYPECVLAIKAIIIVDDNLDYYRHIDNSSYFCNICYGMIIMK